jgi:hypothetical protein
MLKMVIFACFSWVFPVKYLKNKGIFVQQRLVAESARIFLKIVPIVLSVGRVCFLDWNVARKCGKVAHYVRGIRMTRWSVIVSEDTDKALRRFLGEIDEKKDGFSIFIESAVLNEISYRTIQSMKERNAQYPLAIIEAAINDAVREVRAAPRS